MAARERMAWAHAFDRAVLALAIAAAIGLSVAAWHDVSKAWDVWAYHLPFAARIAGIVGPDAYTFGPENQARYEGFPLVAEALQGLFWRVTGRPECASFVSLLSLFSLPLFLRRIFGVPSHVALLAFLAIPLVQIHATQCYVDLPANVGVTLLLLLAYRTWATDEPPSMGVLAGGAALAVATANAKFQLVPIVLAGAIALFARAPRTKEVLILTAMTFPLVFATPLKNLLAHGNPVWPVELHLLGKDLPFAETRYESSPRWLETAPRPLRFLCSILELGLRPIATGRRWSVDQWTPHGEPGYRMGGFFGAYVAAGVLGLVAALARKERTRAAKVAGAFACGATALASVMPQSHELRYYLFWMLFVVSLNVVLWSREAPVFGVLTSLVATTAFAVVAWSTRATYLYPSGDSFAELVDSRVERAVLERARPGERICVAEEPWTFLYAPRFHPGARFTVQEAKRPEDCPRGRP